MSENTLKEATDAPLLSGTLESELSRLSSANALEKKSVASDILFPQIEKHFESFIDKLTKFNFINIYQCVCTF